MLILSLSFLYMKNYTELNNYSFIVKNTKSEKRTHFAVTKGGETAYKELFRLFCALGTKFGSKFVETLRDLYIREKIKK